MEKAKKIIIWIAGIPFGILIIYLVFIIISAIPAIILSPVIIYELIKNSDSWLELSFYHKIVVIIGISVFTIIIIKEIINLINWIKK